QPPPPPPPPPPPEEPPRPREPPQPRSTCHITLGGDVATSATVPATLTSEHWTPVQAPARGSDGTVYGGLVGALPAIEVECKSPELALSVVVEAGPFGPKRYAGPGEVTVTAQAGSGLQGHLGRFTGSVDVTAFDRSHIAGKIDGRVSPLAGGDVSVLATFDIACPSAAGCPPPR
ncbi:MAG: hypothetical protein ACM31C_00165, partial [Acidobacteriota bacterium]